MVGTRLALGVALWSSVLAQTSISAVGPHLHGSRSAALGSRSPSAGEAGLVLDGVIVAANPADSLALVRRAAGSKAQVVRIGQEIDGYVLLEVGRGFARFAGRGSELRLVLPGSSLPSTGGPEISSEPADAEWIRRAFPREDARRRLEKEIPVILSETDLAPNVENGEVRGLRVARLPDGTLLSETGLLPEDVLISINGEPLVTVDALWDIIARLEDREEIRIVVRRRDKVLKLAYAFTP